MENYNLTQPVFYMRKNNFNNDGTLKHNNFLVGKLLIVFIYGDFCMFCKYAKPEFQKAANKNKNKNILFSAIQIDGKEKGERECEFLLDKILKNYKGFPDYAVFYDLKPIKNYEIISRNSENILEILNSLYYYYK